MTKSALSQISDDYTSVGSGVGYKYIGTYDIAKMKSIASTELDEFLTGSPMPYSSFAGQFAEPIYPVKLYKVIYNSVVPEYDNQPTVATGLIAIPETGKSVMPLVSYQHGTVFSKDWVPSTPDNSMETRMILAQFGSQGYIVIGSDYFGMGDSDLPNSYLIRRSSEQACVDMLFATQKILESMGLSYDHLFIHGWSQGGWTNLTFLRKLEALGIKVTAAGTASAPSDFAVTVNRWFNNYQPIDAVYLPACASNFLFAMQYYGQMPGLTERAIKPEYHQLGKDFFEFKIDFDTFYANTPNKLYEYLNEDFRATGLLAEDDFWKMLEFEQAYRWICQTPLRNFYGGKDEVVPVYIGTLPEGFHKLLGAKDTKAVFAGPDADHRATYTYSVVHIKDWFDSFLNK